MDSRDGAIGACGETLMEPDWENGFTCSLPAGHPGDTHRDDTCGNVSTDDAGRKYTWAYEWTIL
jgi:hypothetical protein